MRVHLHLAGRQGRPWRPPDADRIGVADAATRHLRTHLSGPEMVVFRRRAMVRLRWQDGPAHLPGDVRDVFAAIDDLVDGWYYARHLSAVIVAAAMCHQYDPLTADGLDPTPAVLLQRAWAAVKGRPWCTESPFEAHRAHRAVLLCGLAGVSPHAGVGYYATGDVSLATTLFDVGTAALT